MIEFLYLVLIFKLGTLFLNNDEFTEKETFGHGYLVHIAVDLNT